MFWKMGYLLCLFQTFHENKRGIEREREREWERTEKHRNINKVMPKVQERDRE